MKKLVRLPRAALAVLVRAIMRAAACVRSWTVSLARAARAVLVPVAALCFVGAGLEWDRESLVAVGAILWLDFWAARVGGFVLLWRFGPQRRKTEAEAEE